MSIAVATVATLPHVHLPRINGVVASPTARLAALPPPPLPHIQQEPSRVDAAIPVAAAAVGVASMLGGMNTRRRSRCDSRAYFAMLTQRAAGNQSSNDARLSADDADHTVVEVAVRGGAHTIGMKRYMAVHRSSSLPQMRPAIVVVHDGPGLPSRYLEPLGARLRQTSGRACYLYDQLGCGISAVSSPSLVGGHGLEQSVEDLRDVLRFLREELGEPEVHLIGHGSGGILIMEALLRRGLYEGQVVGRDSGARLPALRSVCLVGAPSSVQVAEDEACRLMSEAEQTAGSKDAPHCFWYRHTCGLKPQPVCLSDAYDKVRDRGRFVGALRGWMWRLDANGGGGGWELRAGEGSLGDWELTREDVARLYTKATDSAPLLSVRGAHDFITEACVEGWRGVEDALRQHESSSSSSSRPSSNGFREEVMLGCSHHVHLEDPETFAALLRMWLLAVEDVEPSSSAGGDSVSREGGGAIELDQDALVAEGLRLQLLGRAEARQRLVTWASSLSWGAAGERQVPAWRDPPRLGHKTRPRLASYEARRLANWAWELPVAGAAPGIDSIREMLGTCLASARWAFVRRQATEALPNLQPPVNDMPRVCVGLCSQDSEVEAIFCIEAACGGNEAPRSLEVVGTAAAPNVSKGIVDAAEARIRELIKQVAPAHGPLQQMTSPQSNLR